MAAKHKKDNVMDFVNAKHASAPKLKTEDEMRAEFEEGKQALGIIVDAEIRNGDRVDEIFRMTRNILEAKGEEALLPEDLEQAKTLCKHRIEVLLETKEIIEELDFDAFKEKEVEDKFKEYLIYSSSIESIDDMIHGLMLFNTIRPYGERVENLHRSIYQWVLDTEELSKSEDA